METLLTRSYLSQRDGGAGSGEMEVLGLSWGRNRNKRGFEVRMCKEGQQGGQLGVLRWRAVGNEVKWLLVEGLVRHRRDSCVSEEWHDPTFILTESLWGLGKDRLERAKAEAGRLVRSFAVFQVQL